MEDFSRFRSLSLCNVKITDSHVNDNIQAQNNNNNNGLDQDVTMTNTFPKVAKNNDYKSNKSFNLHGLDNTTDTVSIFYNNEASSIQGKRSCINEQTSKGTKQNMENANLKELLSYDYTHNDIMVLNKLDPESLKYNEGNFLAANNNEYAVSIEKNCYWKDKLSSYNLVDTPLNHGGKYVDSIITIESENSPKVSYNYNENCVTHIEEQSKILYTNDPLKLVSASSPNSENRKTPINNPIGYDQRFCSENSVKRNEVGKTGSLDIIDVSKLTYINNFYNQRYHRVSDPAPPFFSEYLQNRGSKFNNEINSSSEVALNQTNLTKAMCHDVDVLETIKQNDMFYNNYVQDAVSKVDENSNISYANLLYFQLNQKKFEDNNQSKLNVTPVEGNTSYIIPTMSLEPNYTIKQTNSLDDLQFQVNNNVVSSYSQIPEYTNGSNTPNSIIQTRNMQQSFQEKYIPAQTPFDYTKMDPVSLLNEKEINYTQIPEDPIYCSNDFLYNFSCIKHLNQEYEKDDPDFNGSFIQSKILLQQINQKFSISPMKPMGLSSFSLSKSIDFITNIFNKEFESINHLNDLNLDTDNLKSLFLKNIQKGEISITSDESKSIFSDIYINNSFYALNINKFLCKHAFQSIDLLCKWLDEEFKNFLRDFELLIYRYSEIPQQMMNHFAIKEIFTLVNELITFFEEFCMDIDHVTYVFYQETQNPKKMDEAKIITTKCKTFKKQIYNNLQPLFIKFSLKKSKSGSKKTNTKVLRDYEKNFILPDLLRCLIYNGKNGEVKLYRLENVQQGVLHDKIVMSIPHLWSKENNDFICHLCENVYTRKYGLKIHLRTHNNNRPLNCDVCYKTFRDPSNLVKHYRIHYENYDEKKVQSKNFPSPKRGLKPFSLTDFSKNYPNSEIPAIIDMDSISKLQKERKRKINSNNSLE